MSRRIKQRKRFFLAVEGESEQSFIKWIGRLADEQGLHVHLETRVIGGGGFSNLVSEAHRMRTVAARHGTPFRESFLVIDSDRAETGDWSTDRVRAHAKELGLIVCFQRPNHEGVILRMFRGNEMSNFSRSSVDHQIQAVWPNYQKGQNAEKIAQRYLVDDLIRMAKYDEDWKCLLKAIGLM